MIVFPTTPLHQHFTLCPGLFHLFSRSGNILHIQLSHSSSACSFQPQQPRWLGSPPLSCGTIVSYVTFCFTSFHYGLLGQVETMYHGTGVVASVTDKESDLGVDATFFLLRMTINHMVLLLYSSSNGLTCLQKLKSLYSAPQCRENTSSHFSIVFTVRALTGSKAGLGTFTSVKDMLIVLLVYCYVNIFD